jgi:hypothetical protein
MVALDHDEIEFIGSGLERHHELAFSGGGIDGRMRRRGAIKWTLTAESMNIGKPGIKQCYKIVNYSQKF